MPRDTTEILWTGFVFVSSLKQRACPASWYATMFFSFSEMTRERRSGPSETFSRASSKSIWVMTFRFRRAARIAASFTTLARSAPEKPGEIWAIRSRSTVLSSGLPRTWTSRIPLRPLMSGRSRTTWRSNRPGRSSAGSRTSGRFVDARTMTLVPVSKPSISTRIWLRVCSRSSCEPPRPAPRWRPTASISSMNTMHGALRFAWSNRSRTRDAPTPTNISTNSEPEIGADDPEGLRLLLRLERDLGARRLGGVVIDHQLLERAAVVRADVHGLGGVVGLHQSGRVGAQGDRLHLAALDLRDRLVVGHDRGRGALGPVGVEERDAHEDEEHGQDPVLEDAVVEIRCSVLSHPIRTRSLLSMLPV